MKACQEIPSGYQRIQHVDLITDTKMAKKLVIWGGVAGAVTLLVGNFLAPKESSHTASLGFFVLRLMVLMLGSAAYMVLHELTHGAVMKLAGAKKVRFGFTMGAAYAGSEEDWFDKSAYLWIAAAPVLLWGVILGVLCRLVGGEWFWVIWLIQVFNISGSVGDLTMIYLILPMPGPLLIQDTGISMNLWRNLG